MAYVHLNAREWLESQRLAGCEFAEELLDMLDGKGERLDLLESLEEIISEFVPDDITWPNGKKAKDIDDKLRAAFESGRWLDYDL